MSKRGRRPMQRVELDDSESTVKFEEESYAEVERDHKWTPESTKRLLDIYIAHKDEFDDPNNRKRDIWASIMMEMHQAGYGGWNVEALDRKMRNMKRTYRGIKVNNRRNAIVKWEYYDILDDLFRDDQRIQQEQSKRNSFGYRSIDPLSIEALLGTTNSNASIDALLTDELSSESNFATSSKKRSFSNRDRDQDRDQMVLHRKLLAIEERRLSVLTKIAKCSHMNNKIQSERNRLLQQFLERM